MSHSSKLDMLKQAHTLGFKNYLYFISTESADINVRRVADREDIPAWVEIYIFQKLGV
jgi:predicted ABC-type ATPase